MCSLEPSVIRKCLLLGFTNSEFEAGWNASPFGFNARLVVWIVFRGYDVRIEPSRDASRIHTTIDDSFHFTKCNPLVGIHIHEVSIALSFLFATTHSTKSSTAPGQAPSSLHHPNPAFGSLSLAVPLTCSS